MTRILAEEGVDQALAYVAAQRLGILEKVKARASTTAVVLAPRTAPRFELRTKRIFFSDLTREPLQYSIRGHL
jgi:hypothetical protein